MKNWLKKLQRSIAGIATAGFLIILLLLFNILQMLTLLILPFSKKWFRKSNREIANLWWGLVADALSILGLKVEMSGSPIPAQENAVVICNHQQMTDITILFFLAKAKRRLGDMKWFVKQELKYVPGVGWGMQFLDCLFVKRNWYSDRRMIEDTFRKFYQENIPIWLMIFPEGTRRTPKKQLASQTFATQKGLPTLNYVLTPRTKGFVAAVEGLKDHAVAVYDVTIGYVGPSPTLWQLITGKVSKVYLHVERFPINDIKKSENELSQWLITRYAEKDKALEKFYFTRAFN